ncbi:MAG: four helix bundle protein [Thermodesulfovibrionales bacterium]
MDKLEVAICDIKLKRLQADYLRFLHMAFGSRRELHYQIGLSKRLGFLRDQDTELLEPKIVEPEKVLNGLIRALRGKGRSDPLPDISRDITETRKRQKNTL